MSYSQLQCQSSKCGHTENRTMTYLPSIYSKVRGEFTHLRVNNILPPPKFCRHGSSSNIASAQSHCYQFAKAHQSQTALRNYMTRILEACTVTAKSPTCSVTQCNNVCPRTLTVELTDSLLMCSVSYWYMAFHQFLARECIYCHDVRPSVCLSVRLGRACINFVIIRCTLARI